VRQRLQSALGGLQAVATQTSKVLERFSATAERLSLKNSSTLFGCFGGLFGLLLAYGTNIVWPGGSFTVLSVLFSGIGIVGGVLFHRGNRRFRLERRVEENRLAVQEVLERIKSLPKNTPNEVRDELWSAYRLLTAGLTSETVNLSDRPLNTRGNISKRLLAAHTVDGELISSQEGASSQSDSDILSK